MNSDDLCKWLRANSSGIYRPAADAADEIERLRSAIRQVAQAHAWLAFGECRSFGGDGPVLQPHEADALAKASLDA